MNTPFLELPIYKANWKADRMAKKGKFNELNLSVRQD